ncbi:MAG: hypothetical protein JXR73_08735 [Candidatus Omnitrophica bacterium]|nr:hypothetical protein [Candidatus Omnitrophota bacterium]
MSNKRWVKIGCGGCLGIVILLLLIAIVLGAAGYHYFQDVQQNIGVWETRKREINQAYPFTPPENSQIQEERYASFLKIRTQLLIAAEERLDWLFEFMAQTETPGALDKMKMGLRFLNFFAALSEIGLELTKDLDKEKMSMNEYIYMTRLTAGALHQWGQADEENERKAVWRQYMKPVDDLSERVRRIEEENPGAQIDLGPLERSKILDVMETLPTPPQEIEDLIFAHSDEIAVVKSAIFVDAYIAE